MKHTFLLFAFCFLFCSLSWGQGQCPGDCCCPGGGSPTCQLVICVDSQGNYYLCCEQQSARFVKPAESKVEPSMTLLAASSKAPNNLAYLALECRGKPPLVDSKVAAIVLPRRSFKLLLASLFKP
jgi:hypothetical protein